MAMAIWLLVIWLLAIGYLLVAMAMVIGYWVWVIGYEYITMVIDYMDRVTFGL
jgi:hypothetical protein